MHILLVNDDGFYSPSLQLLCRAAAERGHLVTVSAPAQQQSAKSHAFTIEQPLLVREGKMDGARAAYLVEGTPVDACRLGFMSLASQKVDLVISGINAGYNAGLATYVSGTVGAAREAAFHGLPSMAVSSGLNAPAETLSFFASYCIRTAEKLIQTRIPPMTVLNMNIPPVPLSELKEPVVCPLDRNVYMDEYERRVSPRGRVYYWLGPEHPYDVPTPGGDWDYIGKGHITITFLTPDGFEQRMDPLFPVKLQEDR